MEERYQQNNEHNALIAVYTELISLYNEIKANTRYWLPQQEINVSYEEDEEIVVDDNDTMSTDGHNAFTISSDQQQENVENPPMKRQLKI